MCIGTRHFSWPLILGYVIQYVEFMPIFTAFNDIAANSPMEYTTWTDVLTQPQFWLSVIIATGICVLPYYAVHSVWHLLMYPKYLRK